MTAPVLVVGARTGRGRFHIEHSVVPDRTACGREIRTRAPHPRAVEPANVVDVAQWTTCRVCKRTIEFVRLQLSAGAN